MSMYVFDLSITMMDVASIACAILIAGYTFRCDWSRNTEVMPDIFYMYKHMGTNVLLSPLHINVTLVAKVITKAQSLFDDPQDLRGI